MPITARGRVPRQTSARTRRLNVATEDLSRSAGAHNWEFFGNQSAVIVMPRRLAQLRAAGGDDAVQLARFLRLAQVWGILMLGSALALVAACIRPALAWQ